MGDLIKLQFSMIYLTAKDFQLGVLQPLTSGVQYTFDITSQDYYVKQAWIGHFFAYRVEPVKTLIYNSCR